MYCPFLGLAESTPQLLLTGACGVIWALESWTPRAVQLLTITPQVCTPGVRFVRNTANKLLMIRLPVQSITAQPHDFRFKPLGVRKRWRQIDHGTKTWISQVLTVELIKKRHDLL